jgi:hypothetical protein
LYTFGIGAVVDLPHLSALVMGLEDWDVSYCKPIREDRLLAQVQQRMGTQVTALRLPPMRDEAELGLQRAFDDSELVGAPVAPFPRWLRCPLCHLLAPIDSDLFSMKVVPGRPDRAKFVHTNCNKAKTHPPAVLPARFLMACEQGHLDDFPWSWFVHRGQKQCRGALQLRELGVSGEASDVLLECRECGDKRPMADAFGLRADLPLCRGRRPHLRDFEERACVAPRRAILLGASNSWFAVTLTALYVPTPTEDKTLQEVEDGWDLLGDVVSVDILKFLRTQGQLGALAKHDDVTLWAAIEKRRQLGSIPPTPDLKRPEWDALTKPGTGRSATYFQLRASTVPTQFSSWFSKVVLVERLREVTALTGFTRIASPRDFAEEDVPAKVIAPLSRKAPTFVPAVDVRGEGIFLQFNEAKVAAFCHANAEREQELRVAHQAWRRRRGIAPVDEGFPGLRYALLHTFAHALMRAFALECGYSAASLKERIYAADGDGGAPMAGILIYTAAPDAEGTLGGLVRLGEPQELARHIARALGQQGLCSSDPLCGDHVPDKDGTSLHGAACHACLFAPETSCERGNKYLDRSLLVETVCGAASLFGGEA